MISFSMTDIGMRRKVNQDYLFVSEKPVGSLPNLFIVADGMGGHNAGDYASKCCVQSVVEYVKNSKDVTPITIMEGAIQYANQMLLKQSSENEELQGMGTTLVAATISKNKMLVANIGDSRLYLINGGMKQITCDHSLVEAMVQSGELDPKEARYHPNKNVIPRAVGTNSNVKADYFEVEVSNQDTILLCSDGLSNMLEDEEIYAIVKSHLPDINQAGTSLIHKANENGGKDNIAIIIIKL